ncbi:MAG: rod shape-determining protein MreD [Flavobacteriaceae bacterium]|nr:rod shape-determining protein MreD [Bacteroidia bacterium]MBT8288496.1 rod shape-determining protein MreD [Bacteroidia bacterium]NNF75637.1 rod shape-determining protein MreD [Flavobacteriaceae bacterium]NNK71625.1 rod shape-determining protein MreD [Flavobacteriaceae bacterium]
MNNTVTLNIIRFVILVLIQALILNNINFLGYINPYIYILFILLYPIQNNRLLFIFLGFLLGLSVDLFLDSGGVHAAACVFIAYIRPLVLKFAYGMTYEHQTVKISQSEMGQRITYFGILTLLHHLMLISLEVFNSTKVLLILKKTLFSSIFTIILCVLITILFSQKSK